MTSTAASPIRVLIIPGLHDSGPAHWQTWLQTQYKGAVRVVQPHWDRPDLPSWSAQIARTMAKAEAGSKTATQWVAVAHSFGCLALADHLQRQRSARRAAQSGEAQAFSRIETALLVAPADPVKFDLVDRLPTQGLGIPSTLVGSENDPWMPLPRAREWAGHWGSGFLNLGEAGHINAESGFGPWPLARYKVDQMIRHLQRQRRFERAHPLEFSYGI